MRTAPTPPPPAVGAARAEKAGAMARNTKTDRKFASARAQISDQTRSIPVSAICGPGWMPSITKAPIRIAMPLDPGEISLHNGRLAHASSPNQSADRRSGLSLHYIPTETKQVVGAWDSAALVRGEDRYGHFERTPTPAADFDPAAVAFHSRATDAVREILFHDAAKIRPTI